MVEASCAICFDDFPVRDFRVYACGHCFCISCASSLKTAARCPICRELVSSSRGKRLYLNVIESPVEKVELVLRDMERLDIDAEAKSVQRATKAIEKVIGDADGTTSNDVLHLLLGEVQEFKERIIPLFETRETLAAECDFLHDELSTTKDSLSLTTERFRDLERENRKLRYRLQEFTSNTVCEQLQNFITVSQASIFPGQFIPQRRYSSHINSHRYALSDPIYFRSKNSEDGIALYDAFHYRVERLILGDEPVFEMGSSVSIHLGWLGYRHWSRRISTGDFRNPSRPINRAQLAWTVAACVLRFIAEMMWDPLEEDSNERWKVGDGPGQIKFDDLVLISLHHVSTGSWQPQLRLRGVPWLL